MEIYPLCNRLGLEYGSNSKYSPYNDKTVDMAIRDEVEHEANKDEAGVDNIPFIVEKVLRTNSNESQSQLKDKYADEGSIEFHVDIMLIVQVVYVIDEGKDNDN